jgi:hypothetical protein
MRRIFRALALLGLVFAVGACDFDTGLEVENTTAPDRERALASATDVESLVGSGFRNWFYGFNRTYPAWALCVAADECSSSWGNYGMRDISEEPRKAWANSTGYGYRGVAQTPWFEMYENISSMNDGLIAINSGLEIGENGEDTDRAKAFAKMWQAIAHGYLALHFDRAFIFTEEMDLETTEFELVPYTEVMAAALNMLDDAIGMMNGSWSTESNWMGGTVLTASQLKQLANSFYARMMTGVARTPAERDAVNWNEVLSRIAAGITEDFGITLDAGVTFSEHIKRYVPRYDWFRIDYKTIGPCDISGGYQDWLATVPADRTHFEMNCLDKRVQDGGPGDDGTEVTYRISQNFRADRGTYHFSRYYHTRDLYIRQSNTGWDPLMRTTEMDLLRAEALLRTAGATGAAQAADLINKTRVADGGLPPATADGVVGQQDCVPKKLRAVAGGCAGIWETLMYEKRVELFNVSAGLAYWDARGWSVDGKSLLLEGTPYHMPIPALELETLGLAAYTFGGVGGDGASQ